MHVSLDSYTCNLRVLGACILGWLYLLPTKHVEVMELLIRDAS